MKSPERRSPLITALATLVLIGGVIVGATPIGPAPALGPVLDPAHGVWALATAADLPSGAHETIPGLGTSVRVVYDDRAVPHIFAASVEDAVRALGYVVARDRLAQLHIQTLGASGRITEIAGARALALDREMRRLGLPRAAERTLATLDDSTRRLLDAYADGVNAYIDAMPAGALPVEFRLTGASPERWRPLDALLLLERMGWTLAYLFPEGQRAAAASRVGRAAAAALFPEAQPIVEPIQPNGQRAPRVDALHLPPPGSPDTGLAPLVSLLPSRSLGAGSPDEPRHFASNNWAVSPPRTAAGRALLAGDPHLDLTLPSIWYEAHLVVPGVMDVYGVTIPGAPGIIIGFNRDIAWTFTNTGADVLDFYQERVDSVDAPTKYLLDGSWRPLERRVETYRSKNGAAVAVDTLYFTHRGPMQRQGDRWLSMRWTVHDSGSSVLGFLAAARARSGAWGARDPRRQHERQRLDRVHSRRTVAAGEEPGAGLPRLRQPAADRSTRDARLLGRRLRPLARTAHQPAPARGFRRHAGDDAAVADGPGQRARGDVPAASPPRRAALRERERT